MSEIPVTPKTNPFYSMYPNLSMIGYIEKKKEEQDGIVLNGKDTINFYTPHQFEYMVVNLSNGVREGFAALYEDGIKKIEWEYSGGKRTGLFTVYKHGLRMFSGWWNDDGIWDSRYYIEYTPYASILVHCHPTTGTIVYRGGMGKNYHIREGWGVTYDFVTGLPEQYGFFIDNRLVRVYQRFGADSIMYEYSYEDDNVVLGSDLKQSCKAIMEHSDARRRCIYAGGYIQKDGLFYVRNGEGCEKEGSHIFNGKWDMGSAVERYEIIDGYRGGKLSFDCFESIRPRPLEFKKNEKKTEKKVDEVKRQNAEEYMKRKNEMEKKALEEVRKANEDFRTPTESFLRKTTEEFKKTESFRKMDSVKDSAREFYPQEERVNSFEDFRKPVQSTPVAAPSESFKKADSRPMGYVKPSSTYQPRAVPTGDWRSHLNESKRNSSFTNSDEEEVEYETISADAVKAMASRLEKIREENAENLPSLYAEEKKEDEMPAMKPTVTIKEETFARNVIEEEAMEEKVEDAGEKWKEESRLRAKQSLKEMYEENSELEESEELPEDKKEELSNLFENLLKNNPNPHFEPRPEPAREPEPQPQHQAEPELEPEPQPTRRNEFERPQEDFKKDSYSEDDFKTDVKDVKPPVLTRQVDQDEEPPSRDILTDSQKNQLEELLSSALPQNAVKSESYMMEEEESSSEEESKEDIDAIIRKKLEESRSAMNSRISGSSNEKPRTNGWSSSATPFIPKQSISEIPSWKPRSIAQDPNQWLTPKAQARSTFGQSQHEESFAIKSAKTRSFRDAGMLEVVIASTVEYQEMSTSVTHLLIADNSCNDGLLWRFDVSDCTKLIELTIGKNCFKDVDDIRFSDMRVLEKIVIGDNSFMITDPSKECRRFSISGVDKLYKISIGEYVGEEFYEFELRDCHQLRQLSVGSHSFKKMHTLRIENMMSLKEIIIGDETFQGDGDPSKRSAYDIPYNYTNCLILRDLPDLTVLRNHKGSSFNYFGYLTIRNVPKINQRGIELNENNIHFKYAFSFDIKKASTFANYLRKSCPYYNCRVCSKQVNYPVNYPSFALAHLHESLAPSSSHYGIGPTAQPLFFTLLFQPYRY